MWGWQARQQFANGLDLPRINKMVAARLNASHNF
jgi:hypothetical protein